MQKSNIDPYVHPGCDRFYAHLGEIAEVRGRLTP